MGFDAFRQRAFLVSGLNMLIDAALAPYLILLVLGISLSEQVLF